MNFDDFLWLLFFVLIIKDVVLYIRRYRARRPPRAPVCPTDEIDNGNLYLKTQPPCAAPGDPP